MHVFTMVLVPADTQDIKAAVDALLERFNYERRVEPYKVRVEGQKLQAMAEFYGLPETDLPAFISRLKGYYGGVEEGGLDEGGLFYISTGNPQGRWDYWVIGGRWDGVIQGKSCTVSVGPGEDELQYNICPVNELPDDLGAACVITPDGQLYEEEGWGNPTDESIGHWRKTLREVLDQYSDCLVVGVDCHQ